METELSLQNGVKIVLNSHANIHIVNLSKFAKLEKKPCVILYEEVFSHFIDLIDFERSIA